MTNIGKPLRTIQVPEPERVPDTLPEEWPAEAPTEAPELVPASA